MALPPQFLEELRSRISLAQVVSRWVRLQKRGREFVGLCPFHKEKTPSFTVVEDKAFYHCFGCGAHGDVVGFTMRMGNLGFRDAVEMLAKEAGLKVPAETPADRARAEKARTLYDVCEAACQFFERQLREPAGREGLKYLSERGLNDDTIRRFRLGFAPSSRTAMLRALGNEFPQALLLEAGLLRTSEDKGEVFDFFRGRVIFPIADRQGRVVAFGGRVMDDGQPKYLNSPDTPIFDKGRMLFGAHLAREACVAGQVPIVVEGYMDVISLHAAGFGSAVAPLGTALTEYQLLAVWQLGKKPILCFDGDAAGQRAAMKALDRGLPLLKPDYEINFVELPEGEDPDSLIRESGSVEFRRFLNHSIMASDFLWRLEGGTRGLDYYSRPERIGALWGRLKERISQIENRTIQQSFTRFFDGKIWELTVEQRRKAKRILPLDVRFVAAAHDRLAALTDAKRTAKLELILVGTAINHPYVAKSDIDSFAKINPRSRVLNGVWQAVIEELSVNPDIDGGGLRLSLAERGHDSFLKRLFRSDVYESRRFMHFSADDGDVARHWKFTCAEHHLPELFRQLDESVVTFGRESTQENWESVLRLREEVTRFQTAEEFFEQDQMVERTMEWNPAKGAKTPMPVSAGSALSD